MGLTSPVLVYLLAGAGIVLLAAMLWYWPRLAGRGWRPVVLRAAAVCVLQACVLSLIFVMVNRSYVFYSSWSDLLGSDTGTGTVLAVDGGNSQLSAATRVTASSAVTISGHHGAVGVLQAVRFRGQLSGVTVSGHIYLPPGYPQPGRRYPVIMAVSGQAASTSSPYGAARLAASAAVQIASGKLRPVILVVLPAALGADQGCLNVPGSTQAGMFYAQDLPAALETGYHASAVASRWALLGDAAGGYCALQLAMDNSTVFSAAAVPSRSYAGPPGSHEAGNSPQIRNQENLIWQLRHLPMQPVSILFAGPGQKTASRGPAAAFISLVRRPMRVTVAGLSPGTTPLAPVLDWIGRELGA